MPPTGRSSVTISRRERAPRSSAQARPDAIVFEQGGCEHYVSDDDAPTASELARRLGESDPRIALDRYLREELGYVLVPGFIGHASYDACYVRLPPGRTPTQ